MKQEEYYDKMYIRDVYDRIYNKIDWNHGNSEPMQRYEENKVFGPGAYDRYLELIEKYGTNN